VRLVARILFAVSLAGNAMALYLLAVPVAPPPVVPLAKLSPSPVPKPAPVTHRAGDVHAYLEALLARGLTLEETKPLVLVRLVSEAMPAASHAADEYWRPRYTAASLERLRDRFAAAERVRALLLALYGPQARGDTAFRPLFEPLDARYAFLESEHQLALQKYQLERLLARASAPQAGPTPGVPQPASGAGTAVQWRELDARLGKDAALQYLYRFSQLAEQLRAADIELSQAEFRDAFAALLELEEAGADSAGFVRVRASLRATLGDSRFTRLWAARDPLFGVIAAAGRRHTLPEQTVLAAYAVVNDAQDRLAAAAARYAALDPARAGDEMRDIQADTQQRLASLVGDDVARALLGATTEFSVAMRRQSSTNLRE
jgi:hypothetical protein